MVEVKVRLPIHVSDTSALSAQCNFLELSSCVFSRSCCPLMMSVNPSRVVWKALEPVLFHSDRAQYAMQIILATCFDWKKIDQHLERVTKCKATHHNVALTANKSSVIPTFRECKVNVMLPRIRKKYMEVYIIPPATTHIEYYFAGLLIEWEHQRIQAQSISGYIATLGGGFFLCHHFRTAIFLAKQQQRMAVLLNDESMYYTCWIHQAYSHIYAGKFRVADTILIQTLQAIQSEMCEPLNPILVNMCKSARLFCRRMKKASRSASRRMQMVASKGLIDDYQRIRVVQDKSKQYDLVIPFSKVKS